MNNKKRFFVFSDVHGEYKALMNSLNELGYNPSNSNHILVSLGDDFDRGSDSYSVYGLLKNSYSICVKGNHDTFLEEALEKGADGEYVFFNILHNGLYKTICSFAGCEETNYLNAKQLNAYIDKIKTTTPSLLKWLKNKPLYFETKNYIFVHAGLDPNKDNWKDTDEHFMLWDIKYSHEPIYSTHKTVIIGHHHAEKVRQNAINNEFLEDRIRYVYTGCKDENKPVKIGNKIAIDSCSNLTKKVNVLVIEDELLDDETKDKENKLKSEEPTITISGSGITSYFNNSIYTYTITNSANLFNIYR